MQTYPAEGPSVAHKWNRDCKERVEADEKEADGHNQDGPTEAEEETLALPVAFARIIPEMPQKARRISSAKHRKVQKYAQPGTYWM